MRSLRAWFSRLFSFFNKQQSERELSAEMESHLQLHIDDNLRHGLTPAEARRQALLKLGGLEQTKENYRDRRGLPILDVLCQDLRFAARMLRKNPGFTLVAVLTLALGIAANSTIFSFISAVLYTKPPVADSDTLMVIFGTDAKHSYGPNQNPVSAPNYFAWKKANEAFSDIAASDPYYSTSLTGTGEPEHLSSTRVTANYFSVLGVAPELGRTFASGDDQPGHDHVVILYHDLWERKFASDPAIAGKTIRLNGQTYTVIGVMPQRFRFITFPTQIWIPLLLDESAQGAAARENRNLFLFGRLKPGAKVSQAQANVRMLGTIAAQSFRQSEDGWGADTVTLQDYLIRDFNAGPAFAILLAAVGFVLLIACANIAGLLLARATSRGKEMAVRIAIGADRLRLVRQLLTEALLIAILGAGLGLALTVFGNRLMQSTLSFNEAVRLVELHIDWRVLVFTSALAVSSALIFGLVPAFRAWAVEVFPALKNDSSNVSAGTKKNRLRSLLVTGEVAFAVILLSAAGILIKEVADGMNRGVGFDPTHLLTAQISLPESQYKNSAKQIAFYRELVTRLEALPGSASAAITSSLPATGTDRSSFRLQGQENLPRGERSRARHFVVGAHYFSAAQIPLIQGRVFSDRDDASSPAVAIVCEKFVQQFFPKGDALGKLILIDSGDPMQDQWRQIVGVVHNIKNYPLQNSDDPEIYEPYAQHPTQEMSVLLRSDGEPNSLATGLRRAVWSIDAEQPIGSVLSLPDILKNEMAGDQMMCTLLATFGGLALLLAGIGIYGLVAFAVGQRKQEIGIRVALGAAKTSILRMVLRDGMALALVGLALGMAVALALPKFFEAVFQDFKVNGSVVFIVVPLLIGFVTMLACALPARRASRVDPIVALRYE